jgi:hypothetical protein
MIEYEVKNPSHEISSTLFYDAIQTDSSWQMGDFNLVPGANTSNTINFLYNYEWDVEFMDPRPL